MFKEDLKHYLLDFNQVGICVPDRILVHVPQIWLLFIPASSLILVPQVYAFFILLELCLLGLSAVPICHSIKHS